MNDVKKDMEKLSISIENELLGLYNKKYGQKNITKKENEIITLLEKMLSSIEKTENFLNYNL